MFSHSDSTGKNVEIHLLKKQTCEISHFFLPEGFFCQHIVKSNTYWTETKNVLHHSSNPIFYLTSKKKKKKNNLIAIKNLLFKSDLAKGAA